MDPMKEDFGLNLLFSCFVFCFFHVVIVWVFDNVIIVIKDVFFFRANNIILLDINILSMSR